MFESIVLGILVIIVILLFILLFRDPSRNTQKHYYDALNTMTDRLDTRLTQLHDRNSDFERKTVDQLIQFQDKLTNTMTTQTDKLQISVERRLSAIDERVQQNLEQGFKKTNDTFTNIVERLSKIDEAQKKIDALSTEIVSLQDILTDKKTRGTFGEVQLTHILSTIFGERNDAIFQTQYTLSTGVRSDAVVFAPEPLGTLAIDSKFPLENYRRMVDTNLSDFERKEATKLFVSDCKRHIGAISQKYIIAGETSDQAIMFVPAEAIFATINAYHPEIVDYSQSKRVWLASPTTLMSTLTTVQTILVNLEREKYASIIHEQLRSLSTEFDRYRDRWQSLSRKMDGVSEDFKKINITTDKITRRFESIANVDQKELPDNDI